MSGEKGSEIPWPVSGVSEIGQQVHPEDGPSYAGDGDVQNDLNVCEGQDTPVGRVDVEIGRTFADRDHPYFAVLKRNVEAGQCLPFRDLECLAARISRLALEFNEAVRLSRHAGLGVYVDTDDVKDDVAEVSVRVELVMVDL